jgi:hypothetical protein
VGAALAIAVCAAFLLIAAWHFRMAASPMQGESAAVPSVDGKPLFQPSKASTVAVGVVLLGFAALVAATAGLIDTGLPRSVLGWLCYALVLPIAAREVT